MLAFELRAPSCAFPCSALRSGPLYTCGGVIDHLSPPPPSRTCPSCDAGPRPRRFSSRASSRPVLFLLARAVAVRLAAIPLRSTHPTGQ